MTTTPTSTDRWQALDFGPPHPTARSPTTRSSSTTSPTAAIAVITLNRPHADNAITTEMGARLTEIVETIAVRPAVRVVVLTGAGDASLLRRQRPASAQEHDQGGLAAATAGLRPHALHGAPAAQADLRRRQRHRLRRRSELAQSTDFIIASENATFGQPEAMLGLAAGGGSPVLLPASAPPGQGAADADDRRPDQRRRRRTVWAWSTRSIPQPS